MRVIRVFVISALTFIYFREIICLHFVISEGIHWNMWMKAGGLLGRKECCCAYSYAKIWIYVVCEINWHVKDKEFWRNICLWWNLFWYPTSDGGSLANISQTSVQNPWLNLNLNDWKLVMHYWSQIFYRYVEINYIGCRVSNRLSLSHNFSHCSQSFCLNPLQTWAKDPNNTFLSDVFKLTRYEKSDRSRYLQK